MIYVFLILSNEQIKNADRFTGKIATFINVVCYFCNE